MKLTRFKINFNFRRYLLKVGLGLFLFIYSVKIGVSQFNYIPDVIKIAVKESSPPSIALAEVNANFIKHTIAENISTTSLRVGLALLPQLELEEILIDQLEQVDSYNSDKNEVIISEQEIKVYKEDNIYPEDLNPGQLSRLKLAQQKYQVLDQVWNEPKNTEESLGDKIKRLDQNLKEEESKIGSNSKVIVSSVQSNKTGLSLNSNLKPEEQKDSSILTVEGLIEFGRKTDLVLTPDHHIEVRRFAEGIPQEFGVVRLPEATFKIQFQSTYGTIVAQLINANGVVEGQGVLAVQDLIKSKNYRPTLVINHSSKTNINVASAYGTSFQKDFQKNMIFDIFSSLNHSKSVSKETYFDNTYVESEAVVGVVSKNHISTTAIISLSDGADLMLLPERMIKGLTDILSEQGVSLNLEGGDSLIWGEVRKNGKPIEGATIFAERADPVYFGGMHLPDQLRTTTSENGMFVVVVNEPGWKDLFVQLEDGSKIHLNVLTFPGKVAQVFAELPTREVSVSLRSFDAFSGEPARAKVQIQQLEDLIDTGEVGLNVVSVPNTQNISFINVYPEAPYVDSKFSYTKLADFIHIPMIRREWLDQIAGFMQIDSDPNKCTVVGFIQNSNYEFLTGSDDHLNKNLVYFNASGEVVNTGISGGGFILYNQLPGFISVSIQDKKNQRKYHKIAFPENKVVSILNFVL